MHWLDPATESGAGPASESGRRGPPRLPGVPDIPPMPVEASEAPVTTPTNKTIEVEPQWLELVEERRAKNAQKAKASAPMAAAPAVDPTRPRPRVRPIIPREDE